MATPNLDHDTTVVPSMDSDSPTIENVQKGPEQPHRRESIGQATIVRSVATRASTSGPSREHSEQGKVKWNVYFRYLEAASRTAFLIFLLSAIFQQTASVLANVVLRHWGDHNQQQGDNSGMFKYLLEYGIFSLSAIIFSATATLLLWVLCCVRSARHLHDSVGNWPSLRHSSDEICMLQMLNSVIRAPLSFFEMTPTGRYVLC